MEIAPFLTEHFFARYEFSTPYQLCNSDCETVTVAELLALAGVAPEALGALSLGYTETQGDPALREAIAATYATVKAEEVVVLGSPVEGIYLAARALLAPGDEVITLTPAYDALINVFEHVTGAARVKKWAFKPTETGWRLDFGELRALLTPETKVVVVNFPHNPTGFLPARAELEELARIAEEAGVWLFYDEMYHGLFHSGSAALPSAADVTERAVVLSGLSKSYGLPGLRSGWLVIRDKALRERVMNWKYYTSICPPAPSEFLARAALQAREQLVARSIAQIEQNLIVAGAFFERWPDLFRWRPPQAGSTALVEIEVPSATALAEEVAAEAGVLIHPAVTLGGNDQQMRMGFGRAGFAEALAQFERYLQEKGFGER
jgi:aspartate/methionine/tyrosine aminotransferase